MVDRIEQLMDTLEQELNTSEIDMAQCTMYELQKEITELRQGLEQGKNFSLLGESTNG
jgi:hypothetical protein